MSMSAGQLETLDRLLFALRDDELTDSQAAQLERLVLEHPQAMQRYLSAVNLAAGLRWMAEAESEEGEPDSGFGAREADFAASGFAPAAEFPPAAEAVGPPPSVFTLSPLPSPLSHPFVGGPVFSYMAAAVILGVMLLGAWAYKISHFDQFVGGQKTAPTIQRRELVFVGRITGMKDCRWTYPANRSLHGSSCPAWSEIHPGFRLDRNLLQQRRESHP